MHILNIQNPSAKSKGECARIDFHLEILDFNDKLWDENEKNTKTMLSPLSSVHFKCRRVCESKAHSGKRF